MACMGLLPSVLQISINTLHDYISDSGQKQTVSKARFVQLYHTQLSLDRIA